MPQKGLSREPFLGGALFQNLSLLLKEQLENCPFPLSFFLFFFLKSPHFFAHIFGGGFWKTVCVPSIISAASRWWGSWQKTVAADPKGAELCCHIFPSVVALNSLWKRSWKTLFNRMFEKHNVSRCAAGLSAYLSGVGGKDISKEKQLSPPQIHDSSHQMLRLIT